MKRGMLKSLLVASIAATAPILSVGCSSEENKTPKVTGGTTLDLNAKPESRNSGGTGGAVKPGAGSTSGSLDKK